MSSINKTSHYNLSQFGDNANDKPSWRGDYTSDMSKIDAQMFSNATAATTAASNANEAKSTAGNALSQANTNKTNIAKQESYFNALGVTSEQTAQGLKSTIDGKAENSALTSLQGTVSSLSNTVNGKANASSVYNKGESDGRYTAKGGFDGTAQQLNQRIQALETSKPDAKKTPICLCIGDSYANSSETVNPDSSDSTKWPKSLGNIIYNDYRVKNYAISGAGFGIPNKTFTDQINNAYNSTDINNDDVAIIIIAGGRNDVATTSQMLGFANSTFDNARKKFPKARIISVPMLWHNAGFDMYGRQKAAGVAEAAASIGVENVDWAWTWNIGNDGNFSSGDIHPNANGAKVIASYMAAAIRGTYTGRYEAATVNSSNNHVRCNVVASGGMIMATFWGDDSSTSDDLKNGVRLPSWARANQGASPDQFRAWGAGLTNSGNAVSGWLLTDLKSDTSANPRITYHGTPAGNNGCFVCYPW